MQGKRMTHFSAANIYKFSHPSCTSHDAGIKGWLCKKWEEEAHAADFSTSSSRIFVGEENLLQFRHEGVEKTPVKHKHNNRREESA